MNGVFPAHAGMIPTTAGAQSKALGVPRARGDDPGYENYGVNYNLCSPRTRG